MKSATSSLRSALVARFAPAVALLVSGGAHAQSAFSLDGGVVMLDASLVDSSDAHVPEPLDGAAPPALVITETVFSAPPLVPAPLPEAPVEVEVRSARSNASRLTKSADAVTVVNLAQARKRAADLGEVLNRVAGVSVRRYGGLGSEFRLSINGLYDSAVRVFVDGVPIDRVYAVGLANVPLNLIENVEVYRGVVPLRFGADALGGAMNLVRPSRYETSAHASYSVGSFGTHRASLSGRYRHDPSGFIAGVDLFYDRADNDYFIDVEIANTAGQVAPARVRRFHDAYEAYGVAAELGVVDKPWARKFIARAFRSQYEKEIPHNIVMSVPYGEASGGEAVSGVVLNYENTFRERFDLEAVASYSYEDVTFVDKAQWVYDWRGRRIRMRRIPGEIDSRPRDQSTWQHGVFARATLDWRLSPGHKLTASVSPTFTTRTGEERIQLDPSARDPLTAERTLLKSVAGLAYTSGFGLLTRAPKEPEKRRMDHRRLENVLFAKLYVYRVDAEDPLPGNVFVKRASDKNRLGAGDSLRLTVVDDWLMMKGSYEYAVRLPETDEVFGDGARTLANLDLQYELSHNVNLEWIVDKRRTRWGDLWVDLNLFARASDNMIVLLGSDRYYMYHNVYRGRSLGLENTVKWTSPGKYVTLDGQLTYTDQRSVSSRGTFGDFRGDRIPNRPWLHASWGGFLHFESVFTRIDTLEPFYQGRFVGEFFRGWESVGQPASKDVVPSQLSHDVGITYALTPDRGGRFFFTFEVQNLTDARLYDSFGVLRPSRGYSFKVSGTL